MRRSLGPPLQGGMGFWGGVSQGAALGWDWGRPLAFGHESHTQGGRFMGSTFSGEWTRIGACDGSFGVRCLAPLFDRSGPGTGACSRESLTAAFRFLPRS